MIQFKEWVSDWRVGINGLDEHDGRVETGADTDPIRIYAEWRGRPYEVLQVSLYDAALDGGRKMSRVSSRDFDNKVALYSHRTRDTGIARVILNKGRPRYLIEQGSEALEWAAAVEGMPISDMVTAAREGLSRLGRVRRVVRSPKAKKELAILEDVIRQRMFDAEQEIDALKSDLRMIEHERSRLAKKQS